MTLGGCASISETMSEKMADAPLIGLPTGAPQRPAAAPAYPAVHDMPPSRASLLLSDVEQQKLENDLVAARTRQQTEAGLAEPEPPPPPPARPATPPARKKPAPAPASGARATPASSSATIY